MDKDEVLRQFQIDSLTKLLLEQQRVSPFQVFILRNELRATCKGNKKASAYLESLIIEADIALQNILNFYPHK